MLLLFWLHRGLMNLEVDASYVWAGTFLLQVREGIDRPKLLLLEEV